MATVSVKPRIGKKSVSYRARVRINTNTLSKGYYEESKTFKNKPTATSWANERAKILTLQGVPSGEAVNDLKGTSILNLICEYISSKKFQKLGRSKSYALKAIARSDLGLINTQDLNQRHIKEYVENRRDEGVSPYTAYQDLLFLKSALRAGKKLSIYTSEDPIIEAI